MSKSVLLVSITPVKNKKCPQNKTKQTIRYIQRDKDRNGEREGEKERERENPQTHCWFYCNGVNTICLYNINLLRERA